MVAVDSGIGDAQEEKKLYTPGPTAVDITPNKDGGVLKEIIREGTGDELPGSGCKVTVHYCGTLLDGTVFDSSKARNEPFEFDLDKGNVIKAWDIGVATMKKGEIAVLTCKPEYAYGKKGSPNKIPGDATLVFEIEMLSWEKEDLSRSKNGGIIRTILRPGDGYSSPNEAALVEVHVIGKYNGQVFEDRDVVFNLGDGSDFGIVTGVEIALEKFKKGEKSKLDLKPKYAFGAQGKAEFNVPPDAKVEYIVELKNFEKCKEAWELDVSAKLEQALFFKEKATAYFKAGKYDLALKWYSKVIEYIDSDIGFGEEENKERKALLLAARLNLALTYLKTDKYTSAKNECSLALEIDPKNVKGLFRRGQAYIGMKEPELAKAEFETVLKLEPDNKLASNQVKVCEQLLREELKKEKQLYLNMFGQKDKK